MRIEELWLRNYGCFEEVLVQFPSGVVGIVGANGRGKSTLVEGIAWVLYGQQSGSARTKKEGMRRTLAPPSDSVEGRVVFIHEGVAYTVLRKLKGKALLADASVSSQEGLQATGAEPTTEFVSRLLGMDFVSFETSVFTRQKELALLSSLRAGERRERLLRILRIDRIEAALDACRASGREIGAGLEASRARLEGRGADAVSAELDEARRKLDAAKSEAEALKLALEKATEELARLEEAGKVLAKNNEQRAAVQTSIDELKRKMAGLEAKRKACLERIEEGERLRGDAEKLGDSERGAARLEKRVADLRERKAKAAERERLMREAERRKASLERHRKEYAGIVVDEKAGREAEKAAERLAAAEKARGEAAVEAASARAHESALRAEIAKERGHLETVEKLGENAECPTCGRTLGGHFTEMKNGVEGRLEELEKRVKAAEKELSGATKLAAKADKTVTEFAAEAKRLQKAAASEEIKRERRKGMEIRVAELEGEVSDILRRIEELGNVAEAEGLDAALAELAAARETVARCAAAKRVLESAEGAREGLKEAEAGLANAKARVKELGEEIKILGDVAKELDAWRKRHSDARLDVEKAMSGVRERTASAGHIGERAAALERELEGVRKATEAAKRLEADVAELAGAEILLSGFRDHMAGLVRPRLSALVSDLLGRMSGGRYPEASLDDDYELNLLSDGAMHPLRRFSGGEQDMANLALRLAVSEMVAETFGRGGLGLVILDEVFSSLDADYLRETMATLSALSGMFEQVFVVTHQEAVRDGMAHVIVVDDAGVRIE